MFINPLRNCTIYCFMVCDLLQLFKIYLTIMIMGRSYSGVTGTEYNNVFLNQCYLAPNEKLSPATHRLRMEKCPFREKHSYGEVIGYIVVVWRCKKMGRRGMEHVLSFQRMFLSIKSASEHVFTTCGSRPDGGWLVLRRKLTNSGPALKYHVTD